MKTEACMKRNLKAIRLRRIRLCLRNIAWQDKKDGREKDEAEHYRAGIQYDQRE